MEISANIPDIWILKFRTFYQIQIIRSTSLIIAYWVYSIAVIKSISKNHTGVRNVGFNYFKTISKQKVTIKGIVGHLSNNYGTSNWDGNLAKATLLDLQVKSIIDELQVYSIIDNNSKPTQVFLTQVFLTHLCLDKC